MFRLTRREVLKLFLAGAGAALTPWPWRTIASAATASPHDLVISHGTSPSTITGAAIQALGSMGRFVSRGDVVLVKPNIGWDRTPEQAANTNPEVVATLVRLCLGAGAKEVKVFDHPCEDPRRCYVRSGIMEAAKAAGAKVSYVDERRFRKLDIKGEVLPSWEVYQEAVEVDKVINCPILKHHSLARLTMGMKNLMGLVGGDRSRLHWHLNQADLARPRCSPHTHGQWPARGEPEVCRASQYGGGGDRSGGRRCHGGKTLWPRARGDGAPPYRHQAGSRSHGPREA
jgi:hypothetical protein